MPYAPRPFRPAGYVNPRSYQYEKTLPSRQSAKRKVYMGSAWARLREQAVIRDGMQCVKCGTFVMLHVPKDGTGTRAIVDHIVPAMTPEEVLCSLDNLQTLCPGCASVKTSASDGGFGNRRK